MKRQLYLTIFISIFSLALNFAHAQWGQLGVGIGSLTHNAGKVQKDNQGNSDKFEFNPVILGQLPYNLSNSSWSFIAQAGFGLPQDGRDPNISKSYYFLLGDIGYQYQALTFRAGGGLSFTYISSSGGTETLRNGNTTESFPLPDGASTTRNVVANLGAEMRFLETWQAQAEVMLFNPTSSFNRSISYFLGIKYLFTIF